MFKAIQRESTCDSLATQDGRKLFSNLALSPVSKGSSSGMNGKGHRSTILALPLKAGTSQP